MKYFYNGEELNSGIYKIVNTHSGRVYIGGAKQFKTRWETGHGTCLKRNKHRNKFFQRDFNKCFLELGNDDFLEFYILELLPGTTKFQRNPYEEKWIAKFDIQDKIYNIEKHPATGDKSCFSHTPEETRKRMSKALIKFNLENPEMSRKKSVLVKEKMKIDILFAENIMKNFKKGIEACAKTFSEFIIVSPEGEKFYNIKNLAQFARDHDLCPSKLHATVVGRQKTTRGWTAYSVNNLLSEADINNKLKEADKWKVIKDGKIFSGFILNSPIGDKFQNIKNLSKFAKDHGLVAKRLRSLVNGHQKKYKGWTIGSLI